MLKITDKVLISDFDGTLTVNDFGGLVSGIFDFDFMHGGYDKLMHELEKRGVFLIWVTMRSMPFYNCSKNYLHKYAKVTGILLMEPEEFLPAVKK
jgi:phosphatidate phosphatase PAH1